MDLLDRIVGCHKTETAYILLLDFTNNFNGLFKMADSLVSLFVFKLASLNVNGSPIVP